MEVKKFKWKITRILCMILSVLMMITSIPFTALADNFNGTGSGDHTGTSTYEHVGVLSAYHYSQGFRCYIVDSLGRPCSNICDFVRYRPWDVSVLMDAGEKDTLEKTTLMWNTYFNRTGIWANDGATAEKPYKNIIYLGGAKTDGIYTYSPGKIYKDGSQPENEYGVCEPSRLNWDDEDTKDLDNVETLPAKMYTISDLEKFLINDIKAGGYTIDYLSTTGEKTRTSYISPSTGETLEHYTRIVTPIESINNHLLLTGEAMKNFMMRPLDLEAYKTGENDKKIINTFINLLMPEVNGLGVPINGGALVPLFEFNNSEIDEYYTDVYNEYINMSEEERKMTDDPMTQTMLHFKLKVAFEAINWQVSSAGSADLPLMANNKWGYLWTDSQIVYGTVTNVHTYMMSRLNNHMTKSQYAYLYPDCPDYATQYTDWLNYIQQHGIMSSVAWGYPQVAYKIMNPEYSLEPYTREMEDSERGLLTELGGKYNTLGFGVMFFGASLDDYGSETSTWDSKTYPKDNYKPGPAPQNTDPSKPDGPYPSDYPSEGKDYIDKNKDHKFNIVKFYAQKNGDGSYIYQENHTRQQVVHRIDIDNEPGYTVDAYFTSPTFKKPTKKNDSYDVWKNSIQLGEKQGTSSGSITIEPTSADTTLYVRLVEQIDVVKIFEENGVTVKVKTETPTIEDDKYTVKNPEDGFNYEEAQISPDPNVEPKNWENVPKDGIKTEDLTLKIPDTTKVIYIRYTKDSSDNAALVLHENEISHNFNLRDITGDLLKTSRHYKYISVPECDYFYDCGCSDDDDSCDCWSCNDDMDQESPDTYYFEVVNKPSYDTQFVYKWKESNTVYTGKGGGYQGFEVEASPYMEFTLSRAYGDNFSENRSQGSVFFLFFNISTSNHFLNNQINLFSKFEYIRNSEDVKNRHPLFLCNHWKLLFYFF